MASPKSSSRNPPLNISFSGSALESVGTGPLAPDETDVPRQMEREPMSAEVLILGAGPAGLAAGVELQRHGMLPLLLERGIPGESWRRMPANLRLVSPWRANHLTAFQSGRFPAHRAVPAGDYHEYLSELAHASKLAL